MFKSIFVFFVLLFCSLYGFAQRCNVVVKFTIQDSVKKALPAATIIIDSLQHSSAANRSGVFIISNVCEGKHEFTISYEGYTTLQQIIQVDKDTSVIVQLSKKVAILQSVTVTSSYRKREDIATLTTSDIKGLQLLQTRGNTLGESLKSIPGLNSIQTGPSISKPVIHGLHSNRVLILNNGVRQEGQQWGSEHAPEIDPFIASKISIIKGAASVRYGSDAIVGVVLLEPKDLDPKRNAGGEANLVAGSNGHLGAASALLEGRLNGKLEGVSWRVQGTLKRAGNFSTAHYYLENTGLSEGDFSLTSAYTKKNYGAALYYSEFHNKIGIFTGSHVGNADDLFAAFKRPVPITPSYFTYDIARTYQNVTHTLLKANAYYQFKSGSKVELIFADQKNLREEYDIDLPYSTDPNILNAPQISFRIKTQTLDAVFEQAKKNNFSGSFGVTGSTQGNVFKGIRYLISNFRNYTGGAFAIERFTKDKLTLEAGVRYDYRWLQVYKLNNITLQTYHNTSTYSNVTGTAGATYKFNNRFSLNTNIGSGWRAPSINELYIDGIHLSAASYERGDSSLRSERSYNFTFTTKYEDERLSAEVVLYNNIINNFIYAKPSLQPIQLISGTYPFFQYTQVNANLKGIDIDVSYKLFKPLTVISRTSIIRAWNKNIHDYLVFMPADRFDNSIKYFLKPVGKLKDTYISLQNITVSKQSRVPPNSDYVAPPAGYSLFNIGVGGIIPVAKKDININIGVDNVTNVSYRDYLNRFRYYADDLGINAVLRMSLTF